jgi:hypothetical protein
MMKARIIETGGRYSMTNEKRVIEMCVCAKCGNRHFKKIRRN